MFLHLSKQPNLPEYKAILLLLLLSRSLLSGLSSGQFSVLAVDEAGFCLSSQLAPVLCRARSLVMAGDHLQLPPVVLSQVRLGYQD